MKSYISYLFIFSFFLITSCTEDYQLPNLGSKTTIVITGMITNEQGPYYVKVWENVSNISTGEFKKRGINDARVTITDNSGNVDELRSFYTLEVDSVELINPWGSGAELNYFHFYRIPGEEGNDDRLFFEAYRDHKYDPRDGNYFTTSTKGKPGQTYTLKVEYAGNEYTATDYMCFGTVIDSISLEPIGRHIYDNPDGTDGFLVPCAYFEEPQDETNFYMFEVYPYTQYNQPPALNTYIALKNLALKSDGNPDWHLSVISDRFLPSYVYQYKLSQGDSYLKYINGTDVWFSWLGDNNMVDGFYTNMYCISEPGYRYFAELSRQYYQDGGAFSPSPASPPTNFSGGAQGCFIAASVSQYGFYLRNEK